MNRKETAQVLAILKAAYPNFYKNLTPEDAQGIVGVWSMQFADMAADIVLMALNKAISICKYPPSVAEVKEKISSIHWEAQEMMALHYSNNTLSDEELAYYTRIYEETRSYKFSNDVEPSIGNMLAGKKEVKQLSERNE
jgi:hypothetical protein